GGDVPVTAVVARPRRDRGGEHALAGDYPVPVHPLGPLLQATVHVLGDPVDLAGFREDLLLIDADEPLLFREDFDGRIAPPARTHRLLDWFLAFEIALFLERGGDLRFRL